MTSKTMKGNHFFLSNQVLARQNCLPKPHPSPLPSLGSRLDYSHIAQHYNCIEKKQHFTLPVRVLKSGILQIRKKSPRILMISGFWHFFGFAKFKF
jgi:hypothetical protein